MILSKRKSLDAFLRTSLSEGNHMTDDTPTSLLIKDAEEALATALRPIDLSDDGLDNYYSHNLKRVWYVRSTRPDYDFHLTNSHRDKIEEAEKDYKKLVSGDEGQERANDIMAIHIANGRCGSMKHSLSVRDGRTNLSTTTRYTSPIGANRQAP